MKVRQPVQWQPVLTDWFGELMGDIYAGRVSKVWDVLPPSKARHLPHLWVHRDSAPKTIHIPVTEPDDELIKVMDEWLKPPSPSKLKALQAMEHLEALAEEAGWND